MFWATVNHLAATVVCPHPRHGDEPGGYRVEVVSPHARRTRGPYAKTRGRLESVGAAALALVREVGFRGVTTAEVARRVGLTEAQLHHLVPTRDHVLVAALEHADLLSLRSQPDDRPRDVEAAIAAVVRGSTNDREVLRLYAHLCALATDPAHPANDWVVRHQAGAARRYADVLTELQASDYADPDVDPERFGRQLVALWDGLQLQWLLDESFDLASEVRQAFRLATRRDAHLSRQASDHQATRR